MIKEILDTTRNMRDAQLDDLHPAWKWMKKPWYGFIHLSLQVSVATNHSKIFYFPRYRQL
jgi:hypothetical protein